MPRDRPDTARSATGTLRDAIPGAVPSKGRIIPDRGTDDPRPEVARGRPGGWCGMGGDAAAEGWTTLAVAGGVAAEAGPRDDAEGQGGRSRPPRRVLAA